MLGRARDGEREREREYVRSRVVCLFLVPPYSDQQHRCTVSNASFLCTNINNFEQHPQGIIETALTRSKKVRPHRHLHPAPCLCYQNKIILVYRTAGTLNLLRLCRPFPTISIQVLLAYSLAHGAWHSRRRAHSEKEGPSSGDCSSYCIP